MTEIRCDIGLVGLGTMGRNLLLNMADHGFVVAGYNRTPSKVDDLLAQAGNRPIHGAKEMSTLIGLLRRPRSVMLLVPAGRAVDEVIDELTPLLDEGDIIIDGGNSHFRETDRRLRELAGQGLHFIGMGVSGGSEGARHGPSLMPGGDQAAYDRIRPILEAVAAKVNGEPCVTYLGRGSVGHYVKMVHNGIEYGLMQLLAESYDLMKRGLGLDNDALQAVFAGWNQVELNSFLVEITAEILAQPDDRGQDRLLDRILDTAKQKGTGKWTSEEALDLGIPTPTIDLAVTARYLSALKSERQEVAQQLPRPGLSFTGDTQQAIHELRRALYGAMILTYAQGLALLHQASVEHNYNLDLEGVLRIWRGGCIIRAAMLELFRRAYQRQPAPTNMIHDPDLVQLIQENEAGLRVTVQRMAGLAIPAPAFMASLAYLDSYRSPRLPANLIQAQRDYFGAHTYQRTDLSGTFHTDWGDER